MTSGAFSQNGIVPNTVKGITLHKGLFNETLSVFLQNSQYSCHRKHGNSILVGVNIDNDLYDGALYILKMLAPCMRVGTLLHFHEICHPTKRIYSEELRALYDFMTTESSNMILQLLPYVSQSGEAAVFKVIRPPSLKKRNKMKD